MIKRQAHKSQTHQLKALQLLTPHEEQVLRRSQAAREGPFPDGMQLEPAPEQPMETITDMSEATDEEEQIDKFNHVRADRERQGSIDLSALKHMPTVRTNMMEDDDSHQELFSQQHKFSELSPSRVSETE